MSLINWNPGKELFPSIPSFFDRENWQDDFPPTFWKGVQAPAVNIAESDNAYSFEVAVPGMNKEDFKVTVDKGLLTISCEKEEEKEEKDKNYCRKEYSFHSFERTFQIPKNAKIDKVKASYDKGLLIIEMPKTKVEKVKEVKIA